MKTGGSKDVVADAGVADGEYAGPRSVPRLLALFETLSRTPAGVSLADLNQALEIPKSSLLNLMRPLLAEGYLFHEGDIYRLGPATFRLAAGIMAGWNFPRLVRPFLIELSSRTEETTVLSLLDRRAELVSYVEIIEGSHPVRYHIPVGTTRPILTTAAGKIMLAHAEAGWRDRYVRSVAFPVAGSGPASRAALLKELSQVRREGVAVSLDRYIKGVSAVAAPIFGAGGDCVAALTAAGPTERFRANLDHLVRTIKEVAAKASGAIAGGGERPVI